jgi:hypothetical protein
MKQCSDWLKILLERRGQVLAREIIENLYQEVHVRKMLLESGSIILAGFDLGIGTLFIQISKFQL